MATLDGNIIAAQFALGLVDRMVASVAGGVDVATQNISVALQHKIKSYRKNTIKNFSGVRTIIRGDVKFELRDLYVSTNFTHNGNKIDDLELIKSIMTSSKVLIQGTAGGGKTVFMRLINHVFSSRESVFIPIYIELKNIREKKYNGSIMAMVDEYLSNNGLTYSDKKIRELINNSKTIILLDGFDEIDYDQRDSYARQISDLCKVFKNSTLVVSSRPDDAISSIEDLAIYKVNPFTRKQTLELLGKLPYDDDVKSKFITEVTPDFYNKHRTFLSNPLLITMMLMTYNKLAEVPDKEYLFYQNAFITLFTLHDAAKEVFKRKIHTGLPIDDFIRVMAYFCYDSYVDQRYSFSSIDLNERISIAIQAEGLNTKPSDFIKDLITSVCLMQKDGLEITFVHRSFQEYFTAIYISNLDDASYKKALDSICNRSWLDIVFNMLCGINRSQFEKAWSFPVVKALNKKLNNLSCKDITKLIISVLIVSNFGIRYNVVSNIWAERFNSLHFVYNVTMEKFEDKKSEDAAIKFLTDINSSMELLEKVEIESAYIRRDKGDFIDTVAFLVSNDYAILSEYFDIDSWSGMQARNMKKLEGEIAGRIAERTRNFKAASLRRSIRR